MTSMSVVSMPCAQSSILSLSRVGTFIIGAELTTVATAPDGGIYETQLQPAHQCWKSWVLSWRLNKDSDRSGSRRAGGSRFQVLGPYSQRSCVGRSMSWSRVSYHESPRHRRT